MNKKWYEFWKSEKHESILPQTELIIEDEIIEKTSGHILYDLQKEAHSYSINPSDISNIEMLSSVGPLNNLYYVEHTGENRLTNETLKNLSRHPIISSIIQTRVNQAAEFAQFSPDEDLGFRIVLRDSEEEPSDSDKEKIKEITKFIENCGYETIDFELTFESFIRQIIRDSLIYDQCCFEVVRNRADQITGFLPVDAATIKRSKLTKEEVMVGRRNPDSVSFLQVIDNKIVAQFKQKDLCFGIRRPRTDVNAKKMGFPELEELVATMNNLQSAEIFNAGNFNNGISANGIIAVKSKMDPKLFRTFRREFYQLLTGVNNAKRTPLIQLDPEANEEISSINLSTSNREMEYNAWISYLIKTSCSVFQMDPSEIGFVYGSEGQGSSLIQADPATRVIMGKEKGLRPLIRSLQAWLNKYIIWQLDDRFKIEFIGLDSLSVKDKIMIDEHKMKYMTLNEIRATHDLNAIENGDYIADYYGDALKLSQLSLPVEKKVDFDNDGQSHPTQYFTGLDEKTQRQREAEIEQRQEEGITGPELYEDLPGDEDSKTKPSKYTNHPKVKEIREEMKSSDKDEFIRAASKVSGVDKDIIEEVYDKGLKAWATSGHRPGAPAQAWAIARVYAFLFFPDSGARKADVHLWDKHLNKNYCCDDCLEDEDDDSDIQKAENYYIAPDEVATEAQKALDWKEKYGSECCTQVGWKRARQLANKERISETTIRRMYSFFSRHSGNEVVNPKFKNEPWLDCGTMCFYAWGGRSGHQWSKMMVEKFKKEKEQK